MRLGDCDLFLHATTIITNAVIERKGRDFEIARVGAFEVGTGLPLRIPAIDLVEIGAGASAPH